MASAGSSAFKAFKDRCDARQNQKKENVVSFIKSEREKKKRKQEARDQEDKKKRRRRKRKTREDKEAEREEKLNRAVKRTITTVTTDTSSVSTGKTTVQKTTTLKSTASGGQKGLRSTPFVDRARKKVKTKRSRERESEDESDEDRTETPMEVVFGKAAAKLKPGWNQHGRVNISAERIESVVEKARDKTKSENKKAKVKKSLRKSLEAERKEATSQPTQPKGILKRSPSEEEIVVEDEEEMVNKAAPKLKWSAVPGWRPLAPNADSSEEGRRAFEWLVSPVDPTKFFDEVWERKPLLVKRKDASFNAGWFSSIELDSLLRRNSLLFGENIDVVTYSRSGHRETHNPEGRAYASSVWDYYRQGCSVRLLNPQTYSKRCWKMLSTLQEYFGSFVGANVYLTPPGSQGFAPHWDDIEAFVLQLEGSKRWRLYDPRKPEETLPRFSSSNLEQNELGDCIMDAVLEPGDLLYFPRGFIHQADTSETHSLHITVSTYQKTAWADLFEKMIPQALAAAIEEVPDFRRGLPIGYLDHLGISNQDVESAERQRFLETMGSLFDKLKEMAPVDAAVDQVGKSFLHDSLPPSVGEEEATRSCRYAGERWLPDRAEVGFVVELEPETEVKLLRKRVARLVVESDAVWVFYAADNLRTFRARDQMGFEIPAEQAENVETLLRAYPGFVKVEALPAGGLDEKLATVNALYDRGLILTRESLDFNRVDSDSDDDEKVVVVEASSDDEDEDAPELTDVVDEDYDMD